METDFAVAAAKCGAPVNLKASCRDGVTNSPSAVRGCRKATPAWPLARSGGGSARAGRASRASPLDPDGAGGSCRIPAFLNAPAICMQAFTSSTAPSRVSTIRATTCRLPVGLAGGGFTHPSGPRKVQFGACGRRKGTGSRSWRTSPVCRVALPSETGSMGSLVRPAITGSTRQQLVAQRRRLSRIQGR